MAAAQLELPLEAAELAAELEVLQTGTWWIVSEPAGWNPFTHGITGQVTKGRFRGRTFYVRENLLGRGRGSSGRRWAWHLGQHSHGLEEVLEVLATPDVLDALLEAVAAEDGHRRPVVQARRNFTAPEAERLLRWGSEEALEARSDAYMGNVAALADLGYYGRRP
jgi:hypothetical protein